MSARRTFDPSLYLVFDPALAGGCDAQALVGAAIAGGVSLVQFRDKSASTRLQVERARALKAALAPLGVPLIVNDRVDVALAIDADGVHLGQDDMRAAEARRLLGPDAILGLSAATPAEIGEADPAVVDYVGIGPIFATSTKPDAGPPLGIDGFAAIRGALPLPAVAIGGIGAHEATRLVRAGADGVAVVSAICAAAEPERAARGLAAAIASGRTGQERRRAR